MRASVVADATRFRMDPKFLPRILAARQTPNGVFGIKIMASYLDEFVDWLKACHPEVAHEDDRVVVERALPGVRYVHLRRSDLVAQAVSLVRASRTGVFEDTRGVGPAAVDTTFDFDAVDAAVAALQNDNERWQRFFNVVAPAVTLTYEDLVDDPPREIERVLSGIGVTDEPADRFTNIRHARQADAINADWAAKYREATS